MRSYAGAADLLARHGSRVDATTVMNVLRAVGDACEAEDAEAAASLYENGIVPDAASSPEEISIEADGTWFSVQRPQEGGPERFEVKAMCAYAAKEERGGRTRRRQVFHHACVGSGERL